MTAGGDTPAMPERLRMVRLRSALSAEKGGVR